MRAPWRLALALGLLPAAPALASPPSSITDTTPDPLLASLLQQALAQNPELTKVQALTEAERERIPQAKALPDPSLSLGLQNDGFKRLEIGRMENSYYQVALSQGLPWPGKRGLRGDVARLGAEALEAQSTRTRLSLEADVKRAYASLLLVRSQLRLLETQAVFLQQGEAIARTRYEVGQGAQADLLRAQLERTRLNQARFSLQSEERSALAALNRLRAEASDTPIPTQRSFEELGTPAPLHPLEVQSKAEEDEPRAPDRSPGREPGGTEPGSRQAGPPPRLRHDRRPHAPGGPGSHVGSWRLHLPAGVVQAEAAPGRGGAGASPPRPGG